ncbi:MAG: hypothetical protein ABIJ92_00015 [Candidatus Aenigmatarchaeota archaeon]
MIKVVILTAFLFTFLVVSGVNGQLSCVTVDGNTNPCTDTLVFKMTTPDTTESHAELPGQTNYDWEVCCSGVAGLGNACDGNSDIVLKLSGVTDAHVEEDTGTSYSTDVCLTAPNGADCVYYTDPNPCPVDYTCVARTSASTDAHVMNCTTTTYPIKVCCSAAALDDVQTQIISPPASSWHSTDFQVDVQDIRADPSMCVYRVFNTTDKTYPIGAEWASRVCNSVIPNILVGPTGYCQEEGLDTCTVEVNATNTTTGNSATYNRSFGIDLSAPTISIEINSADVYTNDTIVTLTLTLPDDIAGCKYWNEGDGEPGTWNISNCQTSKSWTLNVGDGAKTVHYKIKDVGGFEVEATDIITLDTVKPNCALDPPLGQWSDIPFYINWTGNDASGIANYFVEINDGVWKPFDDPSVICNNLSYDGGECFLGDGNTYDFRCSAIDGALNLGDPSPINTTTVDNTPIIITVFNVSEWVGSASEYWRGTMNFDNNWDALEAGSGIKCYTFQWSLDENNWENVVYNALGDHTGCTTLKNVTFGPDYGPVFPIATQESETYFFRLNAEDNAGRVSDWEYGNTTIDLTYPTINLGATFGPGVNIISLGQDMISGVDTHVIEWRSSFGVGSKSCNSAPAWGGVSTCTESVNQVSALTVNSTVVDRAGNSVFRETVVGTPINFDVHSLNLVLGDSFLMRVNVRNIEDDIANITLSLDGTYPQGLVNFKDVGTWNYSITPDGRELNITNAEPNTEMVYFIELFSSDVYSGTKTLIVDARIWDPFTTTGNDTAIIGVSYPSSFSGLNDIAAVILILISVGMYSRINRRKQT